MVVGSNDFFSLIFWNTGSMQIKCFVLWGGMVVFF